MNLHRRAFLSGAAASAAALTTTGPATAIEPIHAPGRKRMRLSLAAYSLRRQLQAKTDAPGAMDLRGFVDFAAGLDLDAVELTSYFFPKTIDEKYLNDLKRRCHLRGLDISGGAIRNVFTIPPGAELDRWNQHVDTWVDHYARLGAPVIRVFAGNPPKGTDEKQAIDHAIRNLAAACERAGKKGVILGLENHDFLMDVDRLLPIIKAIDSPWFGVNFDSGNIRSDDPYAAMAKIAPYTVNAQIKVALRRAGKKEPTDIDRVIRILSDAGYKGYAVLEYEESTDPTTEIPKYLQRLREAIAKVSE